MNKFCLLLILSASFHSFSQNYFTACNEIPLQLGGGFDISNPSELKQKAFESSEIIYDEESAETSISYSIINNHEDLQEQLGVDAAINARILFVSVKGAFNLDRSRHAASNYTTLMFKAKTGFGNKGFDDYNLKPSAKALIDEEKYDDFIERYGTHFVQKSSTGVSINVFISISNSYFDEYEEMTAEGKGNVIGFIKGDVEINRALSRASNDNALIIEIHSNGPKDGINSLSNIIRSSDNPIDNIQNEISEYLKKFSRESSKTLGYYYTPFSQFGLPKSKINWTSLREKNLIDIKSQYEVCQENMIELLSIKDECYYLKGKEEVRTSFDSFVAEYKTHIDSIINSHKRCLNLSDDYYNDEIFNLPFDEEPIFKIIDDLSIVFDRSLSSTEIEPGKILTWTCDETCPIEQSAHLYYSAVFFDTPSFESLADYTLKPKIEFILDGTSLGVYTYTLTGKSGIVFDKEIDLILLGGKMEFAIVVKEIKATSPDGTEYTIKVLPITNAKLILELN